MKRFKLIINNNLILIIGLTVGVGYAEPDRRC